MKGTTMGLLDRLAGVQDVGRVTVTFREDGNHRVSVERDSATPAALDTPTFDVLLFLNYAAKALHALGSGPAAAALRQHIALSAITLRMDKFEPFTSFIDQQGECVGRLQMSRSGGVSINTRFAVPLADTNNYVLDSVLLVLSSAVSSQPTAEHRIRLADAAEAMEQYYGTVADPSSFKALREAAAVAFEAYRRNVLTSGNAV
jgi:hypothetical protein